MEETYNRLPKAQKEKLEDLLWEIRTFNNTHLYLEVENHMHTQGNMHAQRPKKTLSFYLRENLLSRSPLLSVRVHSRVSQQRMRKVFGFTVCVCFFFVDSFKLLAFKIISVKLLAGH